MYMLYGRAIFLFLQQIEKKILAVGLYSYLDHVFYAFSILQPLPF